MTSFLESLITAFNKNDIECQIESAKFKGSTENTLFITIDVKTETQMGKIKLNLEKFSKTFGKMMLMNNKDINGVVEEYVIILRKLIESGMVKLIDPIDIDKNKVIL